MLIGKKWRPARGLSGTEHSAVQGLGSMTAAARYEHDGGAGEQQLREQVGSTK